MESFIQQGGAFLVAFAAIAFVLARLFKPIVLVVVAFFRDEVLGELRAIRLGLELRGFGVPPRVAATSTPFHPPPSSSDDFTSVNADPPGGSVTATGPPR